MKSPAVCTRVLLITAAFLPALLPLRVFAAPVPVAVGEPFTLQLRPLPPPPLRKAGAAPAVPLRVAALADEAFCAQAAAAAGWELSSRTATMVTLRGSACRAGVLHTIPGLTALTLPLPRPELAPLMDTARVYTFLDEVHGARPSNLPDTYSGEGVILGIIDTEFDTHHGAFLDSLGTTRFLALWDQADTLRNTPPAPFGYGSALYAEQLHGDTLFGLGPSPHGTAMAGFAAGYDYASPSWRGAAPRAHIVGVKYARGGDITPGIIDGIAWITRVADSLGLPCVINLSIGVSYGPHDGTSLVDRAIDEVAGPGRIVVGAAGNDGAANSHVRFSLASDQSGSTIIGHRADTLVHDPVRLRTRAGVDIWGEKEQDLTLTPLLLDTLTLQMRTGATLLSRNFRTPRVLLPDTVTGPGEGDTTVIYVLGERRSALNNKPHFELLALGNNPHLHLGVRLSLSNGGSVDAWNVNKLSLKGLGLEGFTDGDSAFTVNEVGATARRMIVVGATVNKTAVTLWDQTFSQRKSDELRYDLVGYSGRGPTADGRVRPHLVAPGDAVAGPLARNATVFLELIVWPDTTTTRGRYSISGGTSVSSPIVAGIVACMLQVRPDLDTEEARDILSSTAYTDHQTGPLPLPDNSWGSGKVNALGAMQSITGVALPSRTPPTAGREGGAYLSLQGGRRVAVTPPGGATPWRLELLTLDGKLIGLYAGTGAGSVVPEPGIGAGAVVARLRTGAGGGTEAGGGTDAGGGITRRFVFTHR